MAASLAPLPPVFETRLRAVVPAAQIDAVLATFAVAKPTAVRVNTLMNTVDHVAAELSAAGIGLTPVSWFDAAFLVDETERRALTDSAAFHAGRIYIQDLASMAAALAIAVQPGEIVLDLAAAPGGKTLLMAAQMQGSGTIVAVESVKPRFFRLRANLTQQGAEMVQSHLMDGSAAGRRWPARFDRVLLDAPCSSEARFSRLDPQSWAHWSTRKVEEAARKQRRLLHAAIDALRPGGALLYCTCSFAPEENELVVASQLRHYAGQLAVAPLAVPFANTMPGLVVWRKKELDPSLAQAVRILPTSEMDGLFLCKLVKTGP